MMASSQNQFPLSGVIGVVDSLAGHIEMATELGLQCVEIRADLLRTAGAADTEIFALVKSASARGIRSLYTLRHQEQGGTFKGDEDERVRLCEEALQSGATMLDLEHGTKAGAEMAKKSVPIILSYHNFDHMLSVDDLNELTIEIESQRPSAVKVVPTGQTVADAVTMMSWVQRSNAGVARIGFSMGEHGKYSRVFSRACGAPITYAAFGDPVAPGQIDITAMLDRYHCMALSPESHIVAVVATASRYNEYIEQNQSDNTIHVRFNSEQQSDIESHQKAMNIADVVIL